MVPISVPFQFHFCSSLILNVYNITFIGSDINCKYLHDDILYLAIHSLVLQLKLLALFIGSVTDHINKGLLISTFHVKNNVCVLGGGGEGGGKGGEGVHSLYYMCV